MAPYWSDMDTSIEFPHEPILSAQDIYFYSEKARYNHLPALSKLNNQQQVAVYNNEHNALVVAGAGCGKSTTILGKVAYLIASGKATPDEILLLSFNTDAAKELNQKLRRYGMPEIAQTFHKLGKGIIEYVHEFRFSVCDKTEQLIKEFFESGDASLQDLLFSWVAYYKDSFLLFEEFGNNENYGAYLDSLSFESIKSMLNKQHRAVKETEKMKSKPEVLIANWLFENGIEYEYERPYKSANGSTICKPDFYLPEYDIWIEHWGVMENDSVPWIKDPDQRQKYIEDKHRKQRQYANDRVKLINVYLYEYRQRILAETLRARLKSYGVRFRPLTAEQKRNIIRQLVRQRGLANLENLLERFLNLFKSNGYASERDLENLLERTMSSVSLVDKNRTMIFFDLFRRFYRYYDAYLEKSEEIDFSDMIYLATDAVSSGKYKSKYKYILIDEFQDISEDRCHLVQVIQKQTNADCFCVGDDWQSIYRFSGGNLNIFIDFERYFPNHKEYKIEETFRSGQTLVDLAGDFVQRNPYQKRKHLVSKSREPTSIKAFLCPYERSFYTGLSGVVKDIVKTYGEYANVMILVRNWTDLYVFDTNEMGLDWDKTGDGKDTILRHKVHKGLSFEISTVHAAKGLESDIVLILNLRSGPLGFPNQIQDDKLFSELLVKKDDYPYAEERRLFYVALTRAKKACYLLIPPENASVFWHEIAKAPQIQKFYYGHHPMCPRCFGYLVKRTDKTGRTFYGCSNYKPGTYTSCGYTAEIGS